MFTDLKEAEVFVSQLQTRIAAENSPLEDRKSIFHQFSAFLTRLPDPSIDTRPLGDYISLVFSLLEVSEAHQTGPLGKTQAKLAGIVRHIEDNPTNVNTKVAFKLLAQAAITLFPNRAPNPDLIERLPSH